MSIHNLQTNQHKLSTYLNLLKYFTPSCTVGRENLVPLAGADQNLGTHKLWCNLYNSWGFYMSIPSSRCGILAYIFYVLCYFIIHIRSCALLLHKKKTPTWKERLVLLQITKLLKKMKCTSHVDCNSRTELDLSLSVVMITIISVFKLSRIIYYYNTCILFYYSLTCPQTDQYYNMYLRCSKTTQCNTDGSYY